MGDRIFQLFVGSESDIKYIAKMFRKEDGEGKLTGGLDYFGIPYGIRNLSAHKNNKELGAALDRINEGYVFVKDSEGIEREEHYDQILLGTVAGGPNALAPISGFISSWPVLNIYPQFNDPLGIADMISVMRTPSGVYVATCYGTEQSTLAIARIFGMYDPKLRAKIDAYEAKFSERNREFDKRVRGLNTEQLLREGILKQEWFK